MDEYKLPSTENLLGGLISAGIGIGSQYLTPPRRDPVPVAAPVEKKVPWAWIAGGGALILVVIIFILRPSKG